MKMRFNPLVILLLHVGVWISLGTIVSIMMDNYGEKYEVVVPCVDSSGNSFLDNNCTEIKYGNYSPYLILILGIIISILINKIKAEGK